jgi:UPF0755 protein
MRRTIALVVALLVAGAVAVGAVAVVRSHTSEAAPPPPLPPPPPPKPFRIVFPEGFTRRQMAERITAVDAIALHKRGVRPTLSESAYLKATAGKTRVPGFGRTRYGYEGFLFPATYDFFKNTPSKQLVRDQLDAFQENWAKVNLRYARRKNLTPYDVLIIASMIEKEVRAPAERRLVAAVIYNRLHERMPLQIDATIRYAENNWTKPLTDSDLKIDSPYNTYTHTTLPPTPIGNPGLASIQAAAHPANVDYLYYVAKPNGCGHFFTASYQEFLQANQRYESARAAAGGKSPANCS